MKLLMFRETSRLAGAGEENLAGAQRITLATPAGRRAFAGALTTRGQRAQATRRARAGR